MMRHDEPTNKSYLCVGGPRGGERYAVLYGTGFRVPVRENMPDQASEDYKPNAKVRVEFTDYRAEDFITPQGVVTFWVPDRQTPLETITLLLKTYEQHHR